MLKNPDYLLAAFDPLLFSLVWILANPAWPFSRVFYWPLSGHFLSPDGTY